MMILDLIGLAGHAQVVRIDGLVTAAGSKVNGADQQTLLQVHVFFELHFFPTGLTHLY